MPEEAPAPTVTVVEGEVAHAEEAPEEPVAEEEVVEEVTVEVAVEEAPEEPAVEEAPEEEADEECAVHGTIEEVLADYELQEGEETLACTCAVAVDDGEVVEEVQAEPTSFLSKQS